MTLQVQVDLACDFDRNRKLTTWVDCEKPFGVGSIITLKPYPTKYVVEKIYSNKEKLDIKNNWNVGGL